jgi:hypothetical protein
MALIVCGHLSAAEKATHKQKVVVGKDRQTGEEITRDAAALAVNGKGYLPDTLSFEVALQRLFDLEMTLPEEIYCTPAADAGANKPRFTLEYSTSKAAGNGDFTLITGAQWKSDAELKAFDTKNANTPDKQSFGNVVFNKTGTLSELRAGVLANYDEVGNAAFARKAIGEPKVVIKFEPDYNTESAWAHPYAAFDYEARIGKNEYKYYRKGLDRIGSKKATRFPNSYINNFCDGVVDMYKKLGLEPKDGRYTLSGITPKGENRVAFDDYYTQFDIKAP